jgi:uncharacterized protein involved in exopolysaccharide biosynthesis
MNAFTPPDSTVGTGLQSRRDATAEGSATLLGVADFLVRNLRFITLIAVGCAAVAFIATLVRGPVYTAESRFVPQMSNASSSRLAGLAAQFGIDVGAASGQSPSELYASLVQSREILEQVALTSYPTTSDTTAAGPHATLIELLKLKNPDEEQLRLDAVENLRARIAVSADVRTGVITVQTTTPWRAVSEAMNQRIVSLVTDFNQTRRQSQARAEREFLEARSRDAQQQLRDAESRLATFNDQNRVRSSSQLVLEGGRLQRAVDLAQQVFMTLAQNYEQARIEEVRNTPVITVIDSPIGSAKRQRGLAKKATIGFALGVILGLGIALVFEQLRRRRLENPEAFAELRARLRQLWHPLSARRG